METATAKKEVFLKENLEIRVIDVKDLSFRSILNMVDQRSQRDSEVLSVVCDDQANQ